MPISIRFALRSPKKGANYGNPHPLEVWITVNGKRAHFGAVWPIGHGSRLDVNPSDWKIKGQRSSRRDDPVNRKISALSARINSIFDSQCLVAPPTITSVVYELTESIAPPFRGTWLTTPDANPTPGTAQITEESSLLDAYRSWIIDLRVDAGPRPSKAQRISIGRWERGLFLLEEWQRQKAKSVPLCCRVTISWLNDYHTWLQKQQSKKQARPCSAAMASRYIGKISRILDWMVGDDLLTYNSAKKRTWPRYNDKEILFLEPEHVKQLMGLDWTGTKGAALWWFLLMCCTGLDLPDAIAYAQNRDSLERMGVAGAKLVGKRMKPPCESFDVPVLDEVHELFARFPSGVRAVTGDCVNSYTSHIEDELRITWRITCKNARKTFGCMMLISGYYIGEVSRMLGHKRISTTERHYTRIIGTAVDRGRERVGKTSIF